MKKVIFSLLAVCVLYSCSDSNAPEEVVADTTEIVSNDATKVIGEAVEPSDSTTVKADSTNI
jgi:hypothetical protein